jgi:hypothetical protein
MSIVAFRISRLTGGKRRCGARPGKLAANCAIGDRHRSITPGVLAPDCRTADRDQGGRRARPEKGLRFVEGAAPRVVRKPRDK